eukprot:TRINITY_DN23381_c1_g2_i1.p1 TRINITY_DN23381_c1_g2~~TRINITY_DN23381_c1_g2_i1.p1  ORF type:complete len:885 (+),score=141.80 TRINITY_DN23381_c1_g2_i1:54-2708(+)
METLVSFLMGVMLGCVIILLIDTPCQGCGQKICAAGSKKGDTAAQQAPDGIGGIPAVIVHSGAAVAIILLLLVLAVIYYHRKKRASSLTYQKMLQAAEDHHMHCRAAIPNSKRSDSFVDSWKARPLKPSHLFRILRLNVFQINVAGVGFPLYCNTMWRFLQISVLFWLGNGNSATLFGDVVLTACEPFDHAAGANKLARGLAGERAWALWKLFLVVTAFHWWHAKNQRIFTRDFNRKNREMSDYALLVSGLPPWATSEKALKEYFQEVCNAIIHSDGEDEEEEEEEEEAKRCQVPDVVGVSIGYDFSKHLKEVTSLVEDMTIRHELHDNGSRSTFPDFRSSRSDSDSEMDEDSEGTCFSKRPISDRRTLLEGSDELSSDSDGFKPLQPKLLGEEREEAVNMLRSLENSGSVVVVFRYPVHDKRLVRKFQSALKKREFEQQWKLHIQSCDAEPPSLVWEHFAVGLHDRIPALGCLSWSQRTTSLIKMNCIIFVGFCLLCAGYLIIYTRMYNISGKEFKGDVDNDSVEVEAGIPKASVMDVLVVTVCTSLGNILINQLVWACAQNVGYRMKGDRDAYVFRWYTAICLVNMVFNFGVITTTFSEMPEDKLQRVLYEARLGSLLLVFIRGSLVSYALFPLYYIALWFQGLAMVMKEYMMNKERDWGSLRFKAEQAIEPPEWWMQYDSAAIVVMLITSCFCLFFHGFSSSFVFTFDVVWAMLMMFINKYVYLALSRETYISSHRLDKVVTNATSMAVGLLGICVLHWSSRALNGAELMAIPNATVPFNWCLGTVIAISIVYIAALRHEVQGTGDTTEVGSEHVWYANSPYEEAEEALPYNWWNVNPVFCLKQEYGLLDGEGHKCQTFWRHGKSYLQHRQRKSWKGNQRA